MADGTFAVLMAIIGFTDMGMNDCRTEAGCLGRTETQPRIAVSAGQWLERRADTQGEAYVRYDFGHFNGPFRQTAGLSVAADGETWIGYGHTYLVSRDQFFAEFHAMTGLYFDNGGFDLGGPLEFRSGIEVGYEFQNGIRIGLSHDHRSNADLFYDRNPGVESVQVRLSIPTN